MSSFRSLQFPVLLLLLSPAGLAHAEPPSPSEPSTGPAIELPSEPAPAAVPAAVQASPVPADAAPAIPAAQPAAPQTVPTAAPEQRASSTTIGGYAELHFNVERLTGPGASDSTIDLHRFVVFLGHEFTPKLRFYSELEVEHAVASSSDVGEVEVEQAYLDYKVAGEWLGIRAGVFLMPIGIINQWHEPPSFNGVERPSVDTVIIPSTWREGGVGLFGAPLDGLRYQLYLSGGLNAAGFSAAEGIREGHGEVAQARANGLAVSARLEYEPMLGVIAGLSGYYGHAGPNAELFDASGAPASLDVPVMGFAADARAKLHGIELRTEFAYFHIGDTAALRSAFNAQGTALGLDPGSAILGGYVEAAYDVLRAFARDSDQALLPFARLERYDTMFRIAGRPRTAADATYAITELAFGLTYRPIPAVAFKGDFVWANPDGPGPGGRSDATGRLDFGVGTMF